MEAAERALFVSGVRHATETATGGAPLDAALDDLGWPDALDADAFTVHHGSQTKLLGQFGAGLETRITRNFGWINDLSFGVIEGPRNNFGMVRTGINFAF